MKTTLNLDDRVLRAAKIRSAETGETLTRFVENALRGYLESTSAVQADFGFHALIKRGQPIPGVTVDDRDTLYDKARSCS